MSNFRKSQASVHKHPHVLAGYKDFLSPEDAEDAAELVLETLIARLMKTFEGLEIQLLPVKVGPAHTHSNSRDWSDKYNTVYYSYTVEYPDDVILSRIFNVDLAERWAQANENALVRRITGGQSPQLTTKMLPEVYTRVREALAEIDDLKVIRTDLEEKVEDWLYNKGHVTVDVATTAYDEDGDEEIAPESQDPEVVLMYKPGKFSFDVREQGTSIKVKMTLPVSITLSRVSAPSDYDYRRRV